MICSRCYGTLLGCPCWQALLRMGSSLPSSPAVSLRPERSGGFLWRWDHRLQRPSIRAGSHARHPILYASFDESGKSCRRLPHLNDGLLCRPGIFAGRLHHPPDLGVGTCSYVSDYLGQSPRRDTASPKRLPLFEHRPIGYHPGLEEAPERNE